MSPDSKLTCPLCNQNVDQFHRRSHIVPEWAYKELYDETHRLAALDLKKESDRPAQKGLHDSYWCSPCETHSSHFDDYASIVFGERQPNSKEALAINRTTTSKSRTHEDKEVQFTYEHWTGLDAVAIHKFSLACCLRSELAHRSQSNSRLRDEDLDTLKEAYNIPNYDVELLPLQVFRLTHDGTTCLFMSCNVPLAFGSGQFALSFAMAWDAIPRAERGFLMS